MTVTLPSHLYALADRLSLPQSRTLPSYLPPSILSWKCTLLGYSLALPTTLIFLPKRFNGAPLHVAMYSVCGFGTIAPTERIGALRIGEALRLLFTYSPLLRCGGTGLLAFAMSASSFATSPKAARRTRLSPAAAATTTMKIAARTPDIAMEVLLGSSCLPGRSHTQHESLE
eukprot:CAMPEP_0176091750 /NCGR_PEP_ID=MMETSP0120_2-20121206/45959_1 /TAXON_ID=160619 /ORGANISM="Kryptoperidinium foliaceum, Strain CCMP 1326" /LENGTH=171 /DNA_ID=CAMNT_0017425651 /DNA_START=111 /DNA_END=623 /DNA_ORIENTATION=-